VANKYGPLWSSSHKQRGITRIDFGVGFDVLCTQELDVGSRVLQVFGHVPNFMAAAVECLKVLLLFFQSLILKR
jgi:hypothetical protein